MTQNINSSVIGESCIKYVHKSGVTVLMFPMEGYSTCTAQFTVKFGSEDNCFRRENGEVVKIPDGTAHYLEHKLFESEENDALRLFAETGASCNAGTSYDYTMYYFNCTNQFERNLEILLDFVQHPYFTPETVEKERGIIAQEITMYEDSPGWRVLMELLRAVYVNNPIKTDIAGTVESIGEITDTILYDVYNTFYAPSNMYLTITGSFDPEKAIEICDRCFASREPAKFEAIREEEPRETASHRTELKMPVSKPQFAIGFKRPDAVGQAAVDEYILYNILVDILFGDTSDFYTRMRDEGLINETFRVSVFMGRGFVLPNATGESDDPDRLLSEMKKRIRLSKQNPPTKDEFSRIKKATYGNCVRTYNNTENVAQSITEAALQGLSPFSMIESVAAAEYGDMLAKLADLDEENVCLSVVSPL